MTKTKHTAVEVSDALSEWCSLKQATKTMEKRIDELKKTIVSIARSSWKVSKTGTLFLWDDIKKAGAMLITPSVGTKLDTEKAIAYCKEHKLKKCLKFALNDEALIEAVQSGEIPDDDVKKFMVEGLSGTPYIKLIETKPEE